MYKKNQIQGMRRIPDPILTNWYYFFLHFYINVFANCHLRGSISGNLTQIQETCQNKSMTDFFHEADYVIHFYLALKRYSHSASSANLTQMFSHSISVAAWCNDITTAQIGPTKPEIRFCAGSNPARGVSEIRDGEDLWQWSRLEIRLNNFRWSTIPQHLSHFFSNR